MTKKIHFIWISRKNEPIPSKCVDFVKLWKLMYPDWEVTVWGNEVISTFDDSTLQGAWKDATIAEAQVSNRLRILIVQRHGGIYADIDTKPIKPMTELIQQSQDFIVGLTEARMSNGGYIVDMNLFYSTPGHPLLALLLKKFGILRMGNREVNEYVANTAQNITKCPPRYFQGGQLYPETYTLHWPYRMATWVK